MDKVICKAKLIEKVYHEFELVARAKAISIRDSETSMKKGEIVLIVWGKAHNQKSFFIACPHCGVCSFTGKHKIDEVTLTVKPSIVMKCCEWHGFLTNGEFTL